MGAANQVDLIDTSSLRFLAQLDDEKPVIQGRAVLLKIWSRDSQLIATLDTENVVRIWDTNGGLALTRFTSHKKAVLSMAFSYDGRWLLTTSEDSTAAIWDVRTGTRKALLLGHKGGVNTGAFDRTGRYVVTGSEDRTARLWKIDSSKCMLTFVGHDSGVQTTRFGHDEREIVAVTASGIEYHWKVERVPKLRERRPVAEVNECYGVCRLVMHNGLVAVQVASESEGVGENLDMK
jgi:WD40 repeat protein